MAFKLRSKQIVALDTNVFIYASTESSHFFDAANALLKEIKQRSPRVFLSVIILEEFFVRVYKEKRERDLSMLLEFLTCGGLATIVDVDHDIALQAAKLRAKYNLRAPDAFHLATAIKSRASLFITADKRLKGKIGKLAVKSLTDYTD